MLITGSKSRDDRYATYLDVCAIELPEQTKTYEPVPNRRMVDSIKNSAQSLELPLLDEKYILSCKDQVMLGMLRYTTDRPELPLTVLFRNSYGKQASAAIASGPSARACSNLEIFDGDIKHIRRHTPKVWEDFEKYVATVMGTAKTRYEANLKHIDVWKGCEITKERGYELLGLARGKDILTSTMLNTALDHWDKPPEDFRDDLNLWGVYNAGTWAIGQRATADKLLSKSVSLSNLVKSVQWHTHTVAEAK